jgi:hypothetical protein
VNTLAPKLILTPLLVATASLAGRRWGPALSGWLVALPLTSGPIAFFIAIEAGVDVARQAAAGALVGAVAQVAFAAAYSVASSRAWWGGSLAAASLAFAAVAALIPPVGAVPTSMVLAASVALILWRLGRGGTDDRQPSPAPAWDIPARVIVATVLVIAISGVAPLIGGHSAGILATFPIYAAVLATFAHRARGAADARDVLRGLTAGLLGFGAFFLALEWLLARMGVVESFVGALAVGLVVQAAALPVVRGGFGPGKPRSTPG